MRPRPIVILVVALFVSAGGVPQANAQTGQLSAEVLFSNAIEALAAVPGGLDGDPAELRGVQALLDRIVDEHPASDLAVRILMRETIGDVDVAALAARLARAPLSPVEIAPPAARAEGALSAAETAPSDGQSVAESAAAGVAVSVGDGGDAGAAEVAAPAPPGLDAVAALVAEAEALYAAALATDGPEQVEGFRKAQSLLDRIASDHPASDAAVLLLLDLPIGNLDPARVREGMGAENAEPAAEPDAAEPPDQQDLASVPAALEGVAELVAEAEALYATALATDGTEQAEAFRKVQSLLDRIASDHPASDEAVQLMLDLPIGIVDAARVREGVAVAVATPGAAPDAAAPDGEQDLASLMATCFAGVDPGSAVRGDLQITVAAEVGQTGEVVGLPALVAPASVDADARSLFQRALSAIDACAPFGDEVRNRTLTAVFNARGLVSVAVGVEPAQDLPDALSDDPPAAAVEARPATQSGEQALGLDRTVVRELQGRLTALGFDPRGVDGSIGRGTRAAISAWQSARSIPATGFLDATQLAALRQQSQVVYDEWLIRNPASAPQAKSEASRATSPGTSSRATNNARRSTSPTGRYIDRRGCLREPNGRIVPNFRPDCR